MRSLIEKADAQLVRRRVGSTSELTAGLYASLIDELERRGKLVTRPFDATACPDARLADLEKGKIRWFLSTARRERKYALPANTPVVKALDHLRLLDAGNPTHAAVLLFGRMPQRFLYTSEVKCLHFHGTEVE
jgi:predicted HTH transcriptional regulator